MFNNNLIENCCSQHCLHYARPTRPCRSKTQNKYVPENKYNIFETTRPAQSLHELLEVYLASTCEFNTLIHSRLNRWLKNKMFSDILSTGIQIFWWRRLEYETGMVMNILKDNAIIDYKSISAFFVNSLISPWPMQHVHFSDVNIQQFFYVWFYSLSFFMDFD